MSERADIERLARPKPHALRRRDHRSEFVPFRVPPRPLRALRVLHLVPLALAQSIAHAQFATRVLDYSPAPGQFVQDPAFNNPSRALGPPIGGGTLSPDLTKLVSLGGFGGSITLGFDHQILDDPRNPRGLDAIVFGNASFVNGHPNRRFAEAATIEISLDANNNSLADDPWFIIRAPHLPSVPQAALASATWDDNIPDPTFAPAEPSWIPPGRSGQWQTAAYSLPATFIGPVVQNPLGLTATTEAIWGLADHTPTLLLGDTNADNIIDDPAASPAWFYTGPDDPFTVGITHGSGGGDAFDIKWAVNPSTGAPANLPAFDFIRITTAVNSIHATLGEISAEIGAVADVRPLGKRVTTTQIVGPP